MKILVVDDFPTMRRIVKTLLRQSGYDNFVEAEDGGKAYEVLQENPDVAFIVSDWSMPNVSGLEFLKTVRGDPKFKDLPFLMVTAESERDETLAAIEAIKSSACIVKPFTGQALNDKLQKVHTKNSASKKAG